MPMAAGYRRARRAFAGAHSQPAESAHEPADEWSDVVPLDSGRN